MSACLCMHSGLLCMNRPCDHQRRSCRVFMLNWVVNEHVFGEEYLWKITFPEATTQSDQYCREENSAALLNLQPPALSVRVS